MIKSLPNDKSPGPDGFNNEFMKKCWPIIKHDFYKLCNDFFEESVCLRSINSSYITLIPKVDNACLVTDFRPISLSILLLNSSPRFWLIGSSSISLPWSIRINMGSSSPELSKTVWPGHLNTCIFVITPRRRL